MGNTGNRFSGLWRRLLISVPGMPVDTLTRVDWLQGPSLFVDLRQPVELRTPIAAKCLNELTREECLLLARQEGFAGQFHLAGDEAEWLREIDYQPCGLGDCGRLEDHGDLLIEHGLEADYIEYWQRETDTDSTWATRLRPSDDGDAALLLRCGNRFGYARGGSGPARMVLAQRVADLDLEEARRLLDCEISIGTVTAQGWQIERSTLPWRVGATLLPAETDLSNGDMAVWDLDAKGQAFTRRFELHDAEGLPAVAPLPMRTAQAAPSSSPLPVIDIAALGSGDREAETLVVSAIREAAAEVGFLAITGHGIAPAVGERMRASARNFFAQPLETKMASYIGRSTNHRGYVPEGEEQFMAGLLDRKEAFDLALDLPQDAVPPGHPMLGPNQWPALDGFREDVMGWYAAAFAVGQRMLHGFALAMGQPPELLLDRVTAPPSQLRLIHYPYQPGIEDAPGIGAHTDYECFTLLSVTGPGLQVMNKAGEWIDVPAIPGALLVNIGDMFEYWSGGAFVATSHRVRKVPEERYSFPLFFALDYDVELRPLTSVDPHKSIRTGEHLFAQTAQTFRYLKDRMAAGAVALPGAARPLSSFGQEALHRHSSPA
jgi:isopenicillin N synthase-like dioxygenase